MTKSTEWIQLLDLEKQVLLILVRSSKMPQNVAKRAQIILWLDEGRAIATIARKIGMQRKSVYLWRDRWLETPDKFALLAPKPKRENQNLPDKTEPLEAATYDRQQLRKLQKIIIEILSDKPRSGRNPTFTAEQFCAITALACRKPKDENVPITHWSASDLTKEAIDRGIVKSISVRHVGRLLKTS